MKETRVLGCCSFACALTFTALNQWLTPLRLAAERFILHPSTFRNALRSNRR